MKFNFKVYPEKGSSRIHHLSNVNKCLEALRSANVEFVNIHPDDVIDGNEKITLGLVWTILHNFQVIILKYLLIKITC